MAVLQPKSKMPFKKNKTAVKENRLFNALNVIFMILFSILIVFPIWDVIVGSFSSSASLASPGIRLWPENFSLDAYRVVFNDPSIWNSFMISVLKTVIGVTTSVFFTAMVAYAMSKQDLIGRKLFIALGVGTMFFSGGMIPFYLLIRSLGLLDNFLVYIIPALFSFYNMLILMNFFREIPVSLKNQRGLTGRECGASSCKLSCRYQRRF